MVFKIVVTQKALADTSEGIDWYEKQSKGLGKRFYQTIQKRYKIIRSNPYFQIRYEGVRCLPLERFPYMIHFIVDEQRNHIIVLRIICTYRNQNNWVESTKIY
jgi:hypothetical protein